MYLTCKLMAAALVQLLALLVQLATCAHNLEEEYRFSTILDDGYTLHWNFDLEQQTIAFAVNVSTTGWVGFGLSPNGQMPQSDVVIGWVDDDGNTQFHDRFAIDRFLPPVDESQDWFLVSGEEENGYTILEFTRNLTTCDENDLDIMADTARIIWAYHSSKPVSLGSLGSLRHERMGSISLNLIARIIEDRAEENNGFFFIKNKNVSVPNKDTTYWCSVFALPDEVTQQEKYIYKYEPVIAESSKPYVHHAVVFLCSNLNNSHVGTSTECDNVQIDINLCRGGGIVIAGWAVGGDEFIYPQDVAYPIGGEGNSHYIVLDLHYNNPNEVSGVVDDSGIKFSYTSEAPRHRAGILSMGYTPNNFLAIPPGRNNFIVNSLCPGKCTEKFFPLEGITAFGSFLHTHLLGHGLVMRHFRQINECGTLEELKPIVENRKYDFNYQQVINLPNEVKILPGDAIGLQCFYRTTDTRSNVTLGGGSTKEEMCYALLMYYPELNFSFCYSRASLSSYNDFVEHHIHPLQHQNFYNSLHTGDAKSTQVILDQVEWTDDASSMMEDVVGTNLTNICYDPKNSLNSLIVEVPIPSVDCPYEAPDKCAKLNMQSRSCCERLQQTVLSGTIPLAWFSQYLFTMMFTIMTAYYL